MLTQEKIDQMIELRKKGYTYRRIEREVGVSRWSCINYLKDIPIQEREEVWKDVEEEAEAYLKKEGFDNIINFNKVSGNNPTWDYHATRKGKRYLFDVTIDDKKSIIKKIESLKGGYEGIILYYNFSEKTFTPYHLEKIKSW